MRLPLAALLLSVLAAPVSAKTPVTIAAFSNTFLASEAHYRELGEALATAPGAPFDVRLLIRGELGADEDHFNALRRGRVQVVGVSYASVSTAVPEFTVLNAPFLFDGWEETDFVFDNFLIPLLNELLAAGGLHGIRTYGMVWYGFYGRTPVVEPADVQNMRFRALIDRSSQLTAAELNGDMIQIAATEIVTALQTGLVDGGETNELIYAMTGIDREAPHWTASRHTPSMVAVISTKKWWDSLTAEQQNLVDTGYPPAARARAGIRADGERLLARAAENGATLHALSPEARARWVAATLPVHRKLVDAAGGRAHELYDRALEGKRAFAARQR
ncbi:MAG: TRAP transporter substrate-binding protein DctP [Rhodospirillaceae bacterium]|nr:TRAP transporter substrate-binding protein DctP [Rhodospirillaceae bacterium]